MLKRAAVLALALQVLAARPAAAACGRASRCPPVLDVFVWTLAAGLVGGYAAGTGYFVYRDATDDAQSLSFSGTEVSVNLLLGGLMTAGLVDGIRHRKARTIAITAPLALTHTALVVHGAANLWQRRGELEAPSFPDGSAALGWTLGALYVTNTIGWAASAAGDHGRTYGIVEASVNGPLALATGYLAVRELRDGVGPFGLLLGVMTAASGALAVHGIDTALHPYESPGLDFLGTDVAPVVMRDPRGALAPGLAAAGTW